MVYYAGIDCAVDAGATLNRTQTILAQLAQETDPAKRADLLKAFGEALDLRFNKMRNEALEVMQKIENDTHDAIQAIEREIQEMRAAAVTHSRAESERAEKINHKLHNVSNHLMAIDNKINEQAELFAQLIDPYNANEA